MKTNLRFHGVLIGRERAALHQNIVSVPAWDGKTKPSSGADSP